MPYSTPPPNSMLLSQSERSSLFLRLNRCTINRLIYQDTKLYVMCMTSVDMQQTSVLYFSFHAFLAIVSEQKLSSFAVETPSR